MKIIIILMFATLIALSSRAHSAGDPANLAGKTVVCIHPDGYRIVLKFGSTGDYHRDGYWYQTELNGPVLHTYTFVASLSDRYSGRVSGWSFEAFINRSPVSPSE